MRKHVWHNRCSFFTDSKFAEKNKKIIILLLLLLLVNKCLICIWILFPLEFAWLYRQLLTDAFLLHLNEKLTWHFLHASVSTAFFTVPYLYGSLSFKYGTKHIPFMSKAWMPVMIISNQLFSNTSWPWHIITSPWVHISRLI